MKLRDKILSAAISTALAASLFAGTFVSANAAQSGAEQLRILMSSHVYMGQRFTQAAKNATGQPDIQVIDRRGAYGDVYRCSYMYRGNPRTRYIVCD